MGKILVRVKGNNINIDPYRSFDDCVSKHLPRAELMDQLD
jgi:hypothetical protein